MRKINNNLFEQGKAIFLNLYEKEHLFTEHTNLDLFCSNIVSGGTPSRTIEDYWNHRDILWLKNGEVKNNIIISTEEYISKAGLDCSSAKLLPPYTVNMAMYCVSDIQVSLSCVPLATNQAVLNFTTDSFRKSCFLYYLLASLGNNITSHANGSAQQNLSKEKIVAFNFKAPIIQANDFDYFENNIKSRIQITKEIKALLELKNVMLSTVSH